MFNADQTTTIKIVRKDTKQWEGIPTGRRERSELEE